MWHKTKLTNIYIYLSLVQTSTPVSLVLSCSVALIPDPQKLGICVGSRNLDPPSAISPVWVATFEKAFWALIHGSFKGCVCACVRKRGDVLRVGGIFRKTATHYKTATLDATHCKTATHYCDTPQDSDTRCDTLQDWDTLQDSVRFRESTQWRI